MAYLRRIKNTWQLQYRLDGKQCYKQFSPGTPKSVIMAEKKRIEAQLALHKAGVKEFLAAGEVNSTRVTLVQLTEKVIELRKSEVAPITIRKNQAAMKRLMDIVGRELPVSRLSPSHFDAFKKSRFKHAVEESGLRKIPV